jgi:hypothetical protein
MSDNAILEQPGIQIVILGLKIPVLALLLLVVEIKNRWISPVVGGIMLIIMLRVEVFVIKLNDCLFQEC